MKLLFTAILFIALSGFTSCTKDVIEPITPVTPEEELLIADSTYGEYNVEAVIYVDSSGVETNYYTTNLQLVISNTSLELIHNGVNVEHYDYTTTLITSNTNYYYIQSAYGPPCNDYNIYNDVDNMYYITIPTNNVGCYRVIKAYKL